MNSLCTEALNAEECGNFKKAIDLYDKAIIALQKQYNIARGKPLMIEYLFQL